MKSLHEDRPGWKGRGQDLRGVVGMAMIFITVQVSSGYHTGTLRLRYVRVENRHKLSPTLATAHYSCPDNAIRLVAQCELCGYGVSSAEIFTQTWQPCHSWSSKMAVRWRHCGL